MIVVDLYCGVGGASRGYFDAGLDVVGVDKVAQPNYPYGFLQADARDALKALILGEELEFWLPDGNVRHITLDDIDLLHGSPPCQGFTGMAAEGRVWHDYITETRLLMRMTEKPYIIENVTRAPLRKDVLLCGEMFGLRVIRHRIFELGNWSTDTPEHVPHRGRLSGWSRGVKQEGYYFAVYGEGGGKGTVAEWQAAMGIDWTDQRHEIAEAIPPAYTNWLGTRFRAAML